MKKVIIIGILLLFTLTCNREAGSVPPKAIKGVLDLRQWVGDPLTEVDPLSKPIPLDGEWEFYPGEFIEPNPCVSTDTRSCVSSASSSTIPTGEINYITVPGNWNDFLVDGKPIGGQGYATFRLRVLLPSCGDTRTCVLTEEDPLAIKLPSISTAYKLFVNGKLLTEVGKIGKNEGEVEPAFLPQVVPIPLEEQELKILFHVANYHYARGGLWDTIQLGNLSKLQKERENNIHLVFFLFGSLLLMGFYHLGLFALRRKDKSHLFFGMFSILIGLRPFLTGEQYLYPFLPWSLALRLEYLPMYLGTPIFLLFLNSIFPNEMPTRIKQGIVASCSFLSLFVITLPSYYFTQTVLTIQLLILSSLFVTIYTLALGVYRKREGARLFLGGFVLFGSIVFNDILHNLGIFNTGNYGPIGFLIFIFSQAFFLSTRSAKAFNQVEEFSETLETKIEERTKELIETKQEIEEINTFSHLINSLVDLNDIFIEISKYFYKKFGIKGAWLFLPDSKKEHLYAYKAYSYDKIPEEKYDYMKNLKIPLKEKEGGMFYLTYLRKKTLYLSKISKFAFAIDKQIVETLDIKSLLQIPLLRKDECVGILCFSNLGESLHLSKFDIQFIQNLCTQVAGVIETAHLLEVINRTNKEVEILNEISRKANSKLDINEIVDSAMNTIRSYFDIDLCSLSIVNLEKGSINFKYLPTHNALNASDYLTLWAETSLDLHDPSHVHGYVYQTKKTIYTKELEESVNPLEKRMFEAYKMKSFLCIPLVVKENVIGFLNFSKYNELMILSERDIATIEKIAEVLTSAINNSNLMEETQQQKQETVELNQLIKSLNENLNLKVILHKMHTYLNENFMIPYYYFSAVDKRTNSIRVQEMELPEFLSKEDRKKIQKMESPVDATKGGHIFAFKSKRILYAPDVKKRKSMLTEDEIFVLETNRIQSLLILPLLLENEPIGFLDLFSTKKLSLQKDDLTRLSLLGEQLAGIIHGSNLLKQVQDEKEIALVAQSETAKAKEEIEFLNEFAKLINAEFSLDKIFSYAVEELSSKLGADLYWLQLIDESKTLYTRCLVASSENLKIIEEKYKKLRIKLKEDIGSIYFTYTRKKILYVPSNDKINKELSEYDEMFQKDLNFHSTLQIPLLVKKEVIGILHINQFGGMRKLYKKDIKFVDALCEQLAIAVNNSHLYELTETERQKSEKLLLNILPKDVAKELKEKGSSEPVLFESVSVLFTDFKGFTQIAENMSPKDLVEELDRCFSYFDVLMERYGLEKLKTIGDSYMCAGGIPRKNTTHALDCLLAALEIQSIMKQMKELKEAVGMPYWELRLGIHSGPLVAGVIGEKKFAYDVWGDTVNTASRMESSGTPGMINISGSTYELVKDFFECEYRGRVNAKNKGEVDMYYVYRLKDEFSKDEEGKIPNGKFWEKYGGK